MAVLYLRLFIRKIIRGKYRNILAFLFYKKFDEEEKNMKLKMNNVHKFYGEGDNRVEVLKGVNCEVLDGEICVLLGPSGSGKSTLLNIVGGLESADEGCIDIGEDCTSDMSEKDLTQYRRNHLGFVFQFYNLIPNLTV